MPDRWELGELKLRSHSLLKLELSGFGGGIQLEIPFHVLLGKSRKPQVLLIAGVHGDEYEGVAALQDVAKEIDPGAVNGSIVIVPVANPQAFYAGTRRNPVDLGDLNRSFPGNADGSMSERLADLLFRSFVLGSDAVLSMHGWSREATVIPYVEYPAGRSGAGEKSFAIARALGVEFLHPYLWPSGLLVASATQQGIPSVEVEVGGMGTVTPSGLKSYRDIIYRFLGHMKLLDLNDTQTDLSPPVHKLVGHSDCLSNHAGLFRSRVNVGDPVKEGELLGTVHNLAGDCVEDVHSPRAGAVAILRTFSSVQPGDRLIQVFWESGRHPSKRRGESKSAP
jgi:N-alpha-acetyl-L-2,4-diaminobutyrate deacetylase